ncbi:NAD(P)-dependent alcohol dehydrogenase [Chitinimonas sp.]|uniref:zinc-dependent alcohol dehydrogenase family protein n=1 Tax=Chitinimonas sp. TaxID=1934313 RepID=UPI0035B40597
MNSLHYTLQAGEQRFALRTAQRDLPALAANQVLIKVGAASLNYRDWLVLHGLRDTRSGLTPLSDAAGTVLAVGSAVTQWQAGDRVSPAFFADWHDGSFKPQHMASALGGANRDGVLAQHIIADAASLVAVPDHLSLEEAATLPCAGVTAWHALFERGALQGGETVLVQGTGGVAMLALQLASAAGARVIVTSSSDEKLSRARKLGAWQTINYRERENWDEVALEMTDGAGVDHILELGGPTTYTRSLNAIGYGGRIAQIGVLSGFDAAPHITPMQFKNASINGICVGSVKHYERLNAFLTKHRIHPVIDRQFAFDDAEAAYTTLAGASHFGKLVISTN